MIDDGGEVIDERLRRIIAITDDALSALDTEELFRELLERLLSLLDADNAAILLLDHEAQELVTVAALGLEHEGGQDFRVDAGAGYAGRVVTTRTPVIVDCVDPDEMASPYLLETRVVSLVGVPMMASGDVVGVLQLGRVHEQPFTEEDVALLTLVADRAGLTGQARQSREDRATTLALQRSLMPSRLPRVDGLELAARYVPGHRLGIGGDWYDVFALPSGHFGVVVGDVSGHGLRAAVVMGRLRSALRAYALDWDDPADVLTRLDRKARHFETGSLATVLYAMISPARDAMQVSLAGHLAPVLAAPDDPARVLDLPVDVPVGVGQAKSRQSTTVELPTGALALLFTDGLVERRAEPLDQGLKRLCEVVVPARAEMACATVMSRMDIANADDDIALLAVRRTG